MTWYLAVCTGCTPILPQPFSRRAERQAWASAHRATGHLVVDVDQRDRRDDDGGMTWIGQAARGGGGHLFAPAGTPGPVIDLLREPLTRD